jgi:hypothetical protein
MKRSLLFRSTLAGLAGVLILVMLMAFCGFMAGQEMEEYYKVPRGYDNDFVGIEWIFFFALGAMAMFVLIGALAAWAVRNEAPTVKDALKASAIAGTVPVVLTIVGGILLAMAMATSNGNMVYGAIGVIFGALISLVFMSPMIVGTIIACIILSLIGGLLYMMLIRPLKGRHITLPPWQKPLLTGVVGGAIILAFHVIDVLMNHWVYSFAWGQAGIIVFFVVALSFGALAASGLKRSGIGLAGTLQASLAAGLVMGLGRTIGCELGAFARNYNQAGILFSDGIPSMINGMVIAAIGGLLYLAFAGKAPGPAGRPLYTRAVVFGLLAGLALAIIALVPAIAYFVSGNGNSYVYTTAMMATGMTGFLATVVILVAESVLAVKLSPVKTLNDGMAVAAVAGALTGIVSAIGDVIGQLARTVIFSGASSSEPYYSDLILSNLMSALGCAPLRVVVMITFCVIVAVLYSVWIRGLKFRESG